MKTIWIEKKIGKKGIKKNQDERNWIEKKTQDENKFGMKKNGMKKSG